MWCFTPLIRPEASKAGLMGKQQKNERTSWYITAPIRLCPRNGWESSFFWKRLIWKSGTTKATDMNIWGKRSDAGGEVFHNIVLRQITEEEIRTFDHVARGLDWGYAVDPLHYTVNHYDSTRRRLYIFFELHKVGMSNRLLAAEIQKENKGNELVVCDSAEPKSIAELQEYGISAMGAKKVSPTVWFMA